MFEIHLYKTVEYTVQNQSMAGIHFPFVCFNFQQIWDSFMWLDSLFELFSVYIQSVVITLKLYKYSYKTEIFNKNIVFDLGEHEKMDVLTAYLQHFICEMIDVGLWNQYISIAK